MCGGGGGGSIYPTEPQETCPKQVDLQLKDIAHSGNEDVWDSEVSNGDYFDLQPDSHDKTIIVSYEGKPIGRIRNPLLYRCMVNSGYTYRAILISKSNELIRVVR